MRTQGFEHVEGFSPASQVAKLSPGVERKEDWLVHKAFRSTFTYLNKYVNYHQGCFVFRARVGREGTACKFWDIA